MVPANTPPAGTVRYLCVSDLHLGAANSVLTELSTDCTQSLPNRTSVPLRLLADALRKLARLRPGDDKPTLILNGDILELALAGTNEASMNFVRFMEALSSDEFGSASDFPFAEEIYLLPGNHDHHLWNTAAETQYVNHYLSQVPPAARGDCLKPEYHATNMFLNARLGPVPAYLLNALFDGRPTSDPLFGVRFWTVYPNFGLINAARTRAVLFHHGHYVESIYRLMSQAKDVLFPGREQPEAIWDLEAENGAWVDFFWSTLGRSGAVGAKVELVYDKMQDAARFDALLGNLAAGLVPLVPPHWRWLRRPKRALLAFLLRRVARQSLLTREVHETGGPLSAKGLAGLAKYVTENLRPEILRGNENTVPAQVAFLFGHTHKPFERRLPYPGYPGEVEVYNSGGWVADTLTPECRHGGAILVIDDALEVASIRVYQETTTETPSSVEVHTLGGDEQALCRNLRAFIAAQPEPWASISRAISQALTAHRANLRYKVNS